MTKLVIDGKTIYSRDKEGFISKEGFKLGHDVSFILKVETENKGKITAHYYKVPFGLGISSIDQIDKEILQKIIKKNYDNKSINLVCLTPEKMREEKNERTREKRKHEEINQPKEQNKEEIDLSDIYLPPSDDEVNQDSKKQKLEVENPFFLFADSLDESKYQLFSEDVLLNNRKNYGND